LEQTLGHSLQTQRKARGLTIQALAVQAGVHRTTISRWERGESIPFVHELTRVLEILNITPKERQAHYQSIEAPRAMQIAQTGANASLPISLGELLWALRHRAGVSQRAVARITNVAQSLVVKWEKGECWPNMEHLHAFCFAVGATQDELVFLTTRAWNQVEPLPQKREALDDFLLQGRDDSNPVWAGIYLALAARYQSLYRTGKISEPDALSAYGIYAVYLAWRLHKFEEAKQIVAPVIASLGRSRGPLNLAQIAAINCHVAYDDAFGNERRNVPRNYGTRRQWEDNISFLESVSHRFPPRNKRMYNRLRAQNLEKLGSMDEADANYQVNIASASNQREAHGQSWAYVEFLCRQGRFRDALPVLIPPSALAHGTPPLVAIKNWCNHAEVFAGLGDYAEAEGYLTQAVTYAHQHSEPSLSEHEFSRIGSLLK
jgi:transcriptional regulator with XRE-family HTH domain